ncbi:MAG: ATP-binding protein [Candidatus Bathyarchaeia archaeon]
MMKSTSMPSFIESKSMRLTRLTRIIFLVLFFLLLFQNHVFAQYNGSTIRVGIFQNDPIVFIDDTGVPQGVYVDLLQEIANEERWDIQFVPGTWSEGLERLRSAEIDLMTSIAYLDEREVYMDYSHENVLTMWGQVYVHSDSDIQNIFDLHGEMVAILKGGINGINFMVMVNKFDIQCEFRVAETYAEVAKLVASGNVSAGVINNIHGYELEKQFAIKPSPIIFNPFALLFSVPEGKNRHLLETIDSYLAEWRSDPESIYFSITAKWFGLKEKEVLPEWVFNALLFAGGLLLLFSVFLFVLRRQVKVRTKKLTESREVLQKHREHLEELIEERTTELTAANAKLEEKARELEQVNIQLKNIDRLKSRFISSMSHELRTPLNSIIGFTGIMLQGMAGELTEEQRKQLTIVKKSGDHLLALISDVIDVSRIEANQLKLDVKEFDFSDMMSDVRDSFKVAIEEKGLTLVLERPEKLMVEGDERRMKQVIMNFVSNAVKFTDEGAIEILVVEGDGVVEVSVKDTGVGMRKEDMNMLFKQFSRIHVEGRPVEVGTGLGLYISKKISDLLGGKVEVESVYGVGSKFAVAFPLRYGEAMR